MIGHRTTINRARRIGDIYAACHRLDKPGSFAIRDGEVIPVASMYKVLLALEIAEGIVRGNLRADAPIRITKESHSPGGMGLNQFEHPVTLALEDLLYLSLTISDNTASDVLLAHSSLDALHARAKALGLDSFHVVADCRTLLRLAGEDFGYPSEEAAIEATWTPTTDAADLTLERTTRGSTADLARLAGLIAIGRAAHPDACRLVSGVMERQMWTPRFKSSFPSPTWTVASKTGTLSPWRGEFGVVTRDDGAQLAIAVVVRQHHVGTPAELVDRTVGGVARSLAQLALREECADSPREVPSVG